MRTFTNKMSNKVTNNLADLKLCMTTLVVTMGPVLAMAKASEIKENRENTLAMRQDAPQPNYSTQRPTFYRAVPSKLENGSEAPKEVHNMVVGKK